MEFKFRANIVKSKELTIEANDLNEAMEKAKAMFNDPVSLKDWEITNLYFDEIGPIKWMDEKKWER
jgi:hypothetical protein